MNMRTFVTFQSVLEDDSIWDEHDNLLVPAGKAVTERISTQLNEYGFACSQVIQHSFYGWHFEIRKNRLHLDIVLQGGGLPWLLIIGASQAFEDTCMIDEVIEVQDALLAVDNVLRNDSAVSTIIWYTKEEYETGNNRRGAGNPIEWEDDLQR